MSIEIMAQVWKHSALKDGRELLTLLALADWADDNGGCYPSYDTIAKKVRVKKRNYAIRIVKDLIASGELFKVGKDGNHDSNLFVVLTGADTPAAIEKRITKSAAARGIKSVENLQERIKEVVELRAEFASALQCTSAPQETSHSAPQETSLVHHSEPNTSYNHQLEPSRESAPPAATEPPPPKPHEHPYVMAYRDVFRRNPNRAQIVQLAAIPVTPPALERWRVACEAWALCGFNPSNIKGVLDWYRNGIPEKHQYRGAPNAAAPQTRIVNGIIQERVGGTWYNKRPAGESA